MPGQGTIVATGAIAFPPGFAAGPTAAARSRERPDRRAVCENLRRYLAGEPLLNVLDKELLY